MAARIAFDHELSALHADISRMGAQVQDAIERAVAALVDQDAIAAQDIMDKDDAIDDMEEAIDQRCLEIITRQQPVAKDLRDVASAMKLVTDLERIADHASDISERIIALSERKKVMVPHDLIVMGNQSRLMVQGALDAYILGSVQQAESVIAMDDKVDVLYERIKNELIRLMAVDTGSVAEMVDLLLICKYFERIADHAQNVAEWVRFLLEGTYLRFD